MLFSAICAAKKAGGSKDITLGNSTEATRSVAAVKSTDQCSFDSLPLVTGCGCKLSSDPGCSSVPSAGTSCWSSFDLPPDSIDAAALSCDAGTSRELALAALCSSCSGCCAASSSSSSSPSLESSSDVCTSSAALVKSAGSWPALSSSDEDSSSSSASTSDPYSSTGSSASHSSSFTSADLPGSVSPLEGTSSSVSGCKGSSASH